MVAVLREGVELPTKEEKSDEEAGGMAGAMGRSPPGDFDNFLTQRMRITAPNGMLCNAFSYRKVRVFTTNCKKSKLPVYYKL